MTHTIIGQERIQKLLSAAFEKGRLAHAYLFHGQPGVGKDAVALGLAMQMVCQNRTPWGCGQCLSCQQVLKLEHPAYHLIQPVPSQPKAVKEDKYYEILRERALERLANPYWPVDYNPELTTLPVISIDQVREMKQSVMLKIGGGSYRIFHVSQIDKMTEAAANSLLKLLEEPPDRTLLILTTSHPGRILDTIHSRCQSVHFQGLNPEDIEQALTRYWDIAPGQAEFLAKMSGGSLQRALQMADEEFEAQRQVAIGLMDVVLASPWPAVLDWVEATAAGNSKAQVLDMLKLLQALLRDLLQLSLGFEERVLNTDTLPVLRSFLSKHPGFNAEKGLEASSQAIDYIEKNAYLPLALFGLCRSLRQCRH